MKRINCRIFAALFVFALLHAGFPAFAAEQGRASGKAVAPVSVSVSRKTVTLVAGKKETLSARVSPASAAQSIVWSSSKPSVATVTRGGVIKARKPGVCIIKAAAKGSPRVYKVVKVRVRRSKVNRMIAAAKRLRGRPYKSGSACNPPSSFDCSRFTSYVLGKMGIDISGDIVGQAAYARKNFTVISDIGDLKRGDLVYLDTQSDKSVGHVVIYLGGKKMIHASSKARKVVVSQFSSYYVKRFLFGARVWG